MAEYDQHEHVMAGAPICPVLSMAPCVCHAAFLIALHGTLNHSNNAAL